MSDHCEFKKKGPQGLNGYKNVTDSDFSDIYVSVFSSKQGAFTKIVSFVIKNGFSSHDEFFANNRCLIMIFFIIKANSRSI